MFFEFLRLFHEDRSEFLQIQLVVLVGIVVLDEPLGLLARYLRNLWLLLGNVGMFPIGGYKFVALVVLAVLVEFLLQLQQLVHNSKEAVSTDTLLLLGEEFVDLLDLLVHLLRLVDGLHNLFQRVKLDATQRVLVVLFYQLLHLLVGQVHIEAAKQVLQLTS